MNDFVGSEKSRVEWAGEDGRGPNTGEEGPGKKAETARGKSGERGFRCKGGGEDKLIEIA